MGGEAGRRCGTNELWIENYLSQPDDEDHCDAEPEDDDDCDVTADEDCHGDTSGGNNDDDVFSADLANF